MLIAVPLEANCDGPAAFIDVRQFHAEYAASPCEIVPVADALASSKQKRENALVTVGTGGIDDFLRTGRVQSGGPRGVRVCETRSPSGERADHVPQRREDCRQWRSQKLGWHAETTARFQCPYPA